MISINTRLCTLVILTLTALFYALEVQIEKNYNNIIFENLRVIGRLMADQVNGDALEKLTVGDAKDGDAEYKKITNPIKAMHLNTPELKYVYTVHISNGKVKFGIDTADYVDSNHDGVIDHSLLNSDYDEAPKYLKELFVTRLEGTSVEPYSDKWGTFIGAYHPIFNSKKELISVFCVEIEYGKYNMILQSIRAYVTVMWLISCIGIVFISLILKRMSKQNEDLIVLNYKNSAVNNNIRMLELGRMVASLSHEINNPLAIIKASNKIMMKRYGKESHVEMIHRSVERIEKIIKFVKSLVRNDAVGISLGVDLKEMVTDCIDLLSFKLNGSNITILPPLDTAVVVCQEVGIRQVVTNLITNAIEEGVLKIEILIKETENSVELIIQDDGLGIPEALKDKIFSGMYTTKKDGTGLGLILCKEIMDKNGGKLIYKRENDKTMFICYFPK